MSFSKKKNSQILLSKKGEDPLFYKTEILIYDRFPCQHNYFYSPSLKFLCIYMYRYVCIYVCILYMRTTTFVLKELQDKIIDNLP